MDFSDLIGNTENVVATKKIPQIINKSCRRCGQFFKQDMYLPSSSWFFPDGYLDICNNCLSKWLGDGSDLEKADKFCQYADLPFEPNDWMHLADANQNCFISYSRQFGKKNYEELNWKKIHDEWKGILLEGREREKIDVLGEEDFRKLQEKWGKSFSKDQLLRFETMYNDIEKTQSITTAIQKDNARKMCMLSYQIEQAIWNDENKSGTEVKALIGAYDQLAKAADFTPKNAKNIGDFESIGELCAFLEKRGFKNKFYDWNSRDEIDKVMANLQNYTRRIVVGETNISDELNNKLDQIRAINDMEIGEDYDDYSSVQLSEEEADNFNEEFEVDL